MESLHTKKQRKRKKNRHDDDEEEEAEEEDEEEVQMNSKNRLKEAEEASLLESVLFGKLRDPSSLEFGHEFEDENKALVRFHEKEKEQDGDDLGEILEGETKSVRTRKPVWDDEEENETRVNISNVNRLRKLLKVGEDGTVSGKEYVARLRDFHGKLNPGNEWAKLPFEKAKNKNLRKCLELDDSENEYDYNSDGDNFIDANGYVDNDDEQISHILKSTKELVVKNKSRLPSGIIGISRMRDANAEEPSNGVIQSVQFHRNAQILLSAGFDKRIRLFQIDGKRNPKIQSIFLDNFPIQKASFVPDGSKVIASGRRKFYYLYDMNGGMIEKMEPLFGREEKSLESFEVSSDSKTIAFLGNDGYILLASLKSKQLIGTMKMNGSVRAISFTRGGKELLSLGGDGEVYQWDIGTRKCMYKGRDDGCIKGTTLASSSDSNLFATGSNSGVVNLYDHGKFVNGDIKPIKSFMNLVTTIDTLKFNPDAQILAMTSKMKQGALKLVHLPSYTVFSNWPTMRTPLHFVHSLDFSPGGGYLAAGNAAGKVLLFRLQHYERA